MAINLYLARKYDGGLLPKSLEDQARAVQWSIWGMTEIEPLLIQVLMHRRVLPEDQRDAATADAAAEALAKPLSVLNGALSGRRHLLGGEFTVADLNLASVLSWALFTGVGPVLGALYRRGPLPGSRGAALARRVHVAPGRREGQNPVVHGTSGRSHTIRQARRPQESSCRDLLWDPLRATSAR
jgi:glutathione S-transferase